MGLVLLLLGAVLGLQGVNERSNSDSALLELARKTGEAWAAHDIGTLERLIDDPYFHTNLTGRTFNRAEWLAEQVPNFTPRPTITFDDMKVRVFGDTAVLTGRNVVTLRHEGKVARVVALRFTQVWRRYGDTWRRAVFQGTEVAVK